MPRDGRPFRPLNCRRFMCLWRISDQPSLGNDARDRIGDELCHAAIGAPLSTNPLTGSVSAVEWSTRSPDRSFESTPGSPSQAALNATMHGCYDLSAIYTRVLIAVPKRQDF